MHADVAGQAFELFGEREQLAGFLVGLFALLQPGLHLARHLQRDQFAWLEGNELGQFIGTAVVPFHHPADVTHHRLRGHGAEGGDLRHRVAAVLLPHIIDDAVAAVLAEIHVEVRHRHALGIEEAFEQQVVTQRIEVRDPERVRNQRPRSGAAAGADRHIVLFRPVDEVRDDQEVARETHLHDGFALELQSLPIARHLPITLGCVGIELRHALLQPGQRLLPQIGFEGRTARRREQRQLCLAELQFESATAGDFHRVLQSLRQIGEQLGHFGLGLEVLLLGKHPRPALVRQHIAFGDAHARLVRGKFLASEELHRMGGHHRQFYARRQPDRLLDQVLGLRMPCALDFDVIATRKQPGPFGGEALRGLGVARKQRLTNVSVLRAREGDQPVGPVLAQPFAANLCTAAVLIAEERAGQPIA